MDHPRYPVFLSLRQVRCLVVGGGAVAERKTSVLLHHGAKVFLITQNLKPWLKERCLDGTLTLLSTRYDEALLEGMTLVFAATSDGELNHRIALDAREKNIWCNVASDPEAGSFIVPSIIHRGLLSIAISTGGASPALARQIREELESRFPSDWEHVLRFMELLRQKVQYKGLGTSTNQDIFRKVSRLPLLEWVQNRQDHVAVTSIVNVCEPFLTKEEIELTWKEVWNPSSS